MPVKVSLCLFLSSLSLVLVESSLTKAEETTTSTSSLLDEVDQGDWSYEPAYNSQDPKEIIRHKAQMRAKQRAERIAAMRWYGMYNERPTANPTPFTSIYSPVWQMPGGRPYAWNKYQKTNSVYWYPRW